MRLDHAVVAVLDLDEAIQEYRDLGFTVLRGGVHANGATHNALICFVNGTYIELLAPTGAAPAPDAIDFSVLLRPEEGLTGFALGTDDLDADVARLNASGIAAGPIVPGERRRGDGTLIRWKLAQIDGGFAPFLIQDLTPRTLRVPDSPDATTHANRVGGLGGIQIQVSARSMAAVSRRYAAIVGLELPESSAHTDQEIHLKIGRIVLMETPDETDSAEVLYAVEMFHDQPKRFSQDKTNGIHFEP